MSNMRFKANTLLDVTNMQNMQNHMHNMHNIQSWLQYVGYAPPLFADVVLDHGIGVQHWIIHKFMKIKVQYPLSIHGIYQIYTASRNIHGVYVIYTYYIPRRGSRSSGFLPNSAWSCDIRISGCHTWYQSSFFGAVISELLWYRSIADIRYYDIGYYDIGISLISEVLWYRSFPDITVPLISEFASCDIRIYGYHSCELWYRSYSDFWVPNIVPDITVSELWYRDIYWCHSSWYQSYSDIRIPDIIPDVSLPQPVTGLAFQLILLVQYQ